MNLIASAKRILRRVGIQPGKSSNRDEQIVHLQPEGQSRGRVLLSYVLDPFLLAPGATISRDHTNHWESWKIAGTFVERGFMVDVISYHNRRFRPEHDYDYFIGSRSNFQRIAGRLNANCIKSVHLDTANWIFNNAAAYQRLLNLQQRRGMTLHNIKMVEPNLAIENADLATVLGNQFTVDTYAYAHKPLHQIPISAPEVYDWDDEKNFDRVRNRFLWFGSSGFVHKGLDLVLEAFARMPEMELVVCGPFNEEAAFLEAFHRELYETPNIDAVGWVDVASNQFRAIARSCAGLVYPSCSEGGGGSAITCMHAGLIPILSYETSVDVGSGGVILRENTIDEICSVVQGVAEAPASELQDRSREAWKQARGRHTRAIFAQEFADFVDGTLIGR